MFGRRRREHQEQVIAARGAAAAAFIALDEAAVKIMHRVSFAAHVDGSARGQALLDRARLVSQEADEAVLDWLALESGLEADPADEPESGQAHLYVELCDRLRRARNGFDHLLVEVAADLGAIEQAMAAIPRRVYDAHRAMVHAEGAVQPLRQEGLAPEALEQALLRVQQRAEVLADGVAVHGVAEMLDATDEITAIADEVRKRAEEFPHQRDRVARRLVAVRNHLDVAQERLRLDAAIAALQRRYADVSWHDLTAVPANFQAAIDEADDALEQAQATARRLAYPPALRHLERARVAVVKAEEQVRLVTGRLAMLDSLAADPQSPLAALRFELDEARIRCRSLGAAGSNESVVRVAQRLAAVPALLSVEQPDYYGYQLELDAIKEDLAGVSIELYDEMRRQG